MKECQNKQNRDDDDPNREKIEKLTTPENKDLRPNHRRKINPNAKSFTYPTITRSTNSYPPPQIYHQRYKRRSHKKEPKFNNRYRSRERNSTHLICSNCGGKNHLFKECKKPIQSHGIIAVRPWINENGKKDLQVLLIRRKNTISYEAFVRGKYKHDELPVHLIRMTSAEKEKITKKEWEDLYEEVCFYKNSKHYHRERKHAKEMYDSINISEIFESTQSEFDEPEWEFPKGRKYSYETEKQCAVREFKEETNINHSNLILIDTTFRESFVGTNKRKYMNQYFVGIINQEANEPYIDPTSKNQISEIGEVEWVSFDEACSRIRSFHQQKLKILKDLHANLIEKIDIIEDLHSKTTQQLFSIHKDPNYQKFL